MRKVLDMLLDEIGFAQALYRPQLGAQFCDSTFRQVMGLEFVSQQDLIALLPGGLLQLRALHQALVPGAGLVLPAIAPVIVTQCFAPLQDGVFVELRGALNHGAASVVVTGEQACAQAQADDSVLRGSQVQSAELLQRGIGVVPDGTGEPGALVGVIQGEFSAAREARV